MVRLTAEVIENSGQTINAVRDRELRLRGLRIPEIENLGATYDQFDLIDFSDNDIRKLDGFPILLRLRTIFLTNNRIVRIGEDVGKNVPNVNSVILMHNNLQELGDLDPLATFKNLEHLSLLGNPVTHKNHYRYYVIHKIPQVRVLDFKRVKLAERNCAKDLFKGKKGKALQSRIGKKAPAIPTTVVSGEGGRAASAIPNKNVLTVDDINAIKDAITKADSLEEVERLNQMLQAGQIPRRLQKENKPPEGREETNGLSEEQEEMETTQS